MLELDVDGAQPQLALTKTVVVHPLRPYIEHVDLLVIKRGEKVEVELDVVVTGEAAPDRWSPRTSTPSWSRPTC